MRIKESVFYENQENHDEKRILEFLKKILEKHFLKKTSKKFLKKF
jgi:hypothetical protein